LEERPGSQVGVFLQGEGSDVATSSIFLLVPCLAGGASKTAHDSSCTYQWSGGYKFSPAEELIDPSVQGLKTIFFDDDEVLPVKSFLTQFQVSLRGCGLKTAVDETLVIRLIRSYASSKLPVSLIQTCVRELLKSTCQWTALGGNQKGSELRKVKWLPVINLEGNLVLTSPDQCRGLTDQLLVGFQMPIFKTPISTDWEGKLGWLDRVPNQTLLEQLKEGLERKDRAVVDAVLAYIARGGQVALLADQLSRLPCILTSTGQFITPLKAFYPPTSSAMTCQRLQPYLGNVENKFWQDHEVLLAALKIRKGPLPKDLLTVQKTLESKVPLDEADTAVAIEVLNLASHFPRSSLGDLKVLCKDGNFCPIHEINYHNIGLLSPAEKVNLTHPDIPQKTITKLGIESLSERLMKGMLEIADIDDEDEFDQRERVTTRITNTLDRYPLSTTFREYLANADDTKGTSKISWLLDERNHHYKNLLTPELGKFHGPALLVHNDGGKYFAGGSI
jgi:sacsin